jgi:glucose/arabinose dehydrogenase
MSVRNSARVPNRNRWSVHQLESRLMLAGDVSDAVTSGASEVSAPDSEVQLEEEIAFLDPSVEGMTELTNLVHRGVELVLLDPQADVIEQISAVLRNRSAIRALHIVSHGQPGEIQIGEQVISARQLELHADKLRAWRAVLSPNADILLYGCDSASGQVGEAFLQTWSQLTGADVAGSANRTGGSARRGDWILEVATGQIETGLLASAKDLQQLDVLLPITIQAAGSTNLEQMQLQIDGVTVQTWNNIGGNAGAGTFQTYTYSGGAGVTADRVRVLFTNDLYNPAQGIDRNLRIDSINVNGTVFQTEHPSVFSTGTWKAADGIQPGFRQSEWLHANGYFQYDDLTPNSGSAITIHAAGNENTETMQLWINGSLVQTWNNIGGNAYARQFVAYQYTHSSTVIDDDVQIRFTNDLYLNNGETDRNLRVDRIVIDGATFQTEAPNVYSTGTYQNGSITPGFKQDETLHSNGYFQYGDGLNAGVIALETSTISVNENAGSATARVIRSGGSAGTITVNYNTQPGSATAGSDYTTTTGTLTFASGETVKSIVIPILNDSLVESTEQFNVTIDNVTGGATLLVPRTATVTIVDDEVSLPNYVNFTSVAGLTLNGNAKKTADYLELTSAINNQTGSGFFNSALTLDNDASFRSAFAFQIAAGTGADGLTFVVQNDPRGATAIGGSGASLGYTGITNSVAVEFDTFPSAGDPNNNHISLVSGTTTFKTAAPSFDLNSGTRYYAWVDYNGVSDVLAVYVSTTATKPALALMKTTVDLEVVVGTQAFFGFTAATGGLNDSHRILSWQVDQQVPPQDPPTQDGSTVVATNIVTAGISQPTAVDWLPNGTMLIAQKNGVVKTANASGTVAASPFIDISAMVNGVRDRGLLDLAVHPDFVNNPYVYLLFTYDPPEVFNQQVGTLAGPDGIGNRAGRLIRVTADAANAYKTAVAGSEVVLLGTNSTWANFNGFVNSTTNFTAAPAGELPDGTYLQDFINSDSESHTVGGLAFAPDGALFVSIGDGASYNQVDVRADRVQHIDSLSGKVLRINPINGDGLPDNPFYNGNPDANRSKVYQLGLRNPFRISVDPRDGQLFVGDVGWGQWEEINAAGPGANFGWPFYEGGSGTSLVQGGYANTPQGQAFFANNVSVVPSIYALNHAADGINAIVMGDVYTGSLYGSQYVGDVFFNDLGQGIVRHASLDASGNVTDVQTFVTGANVVVAISQGPDGALYYVDLDDSVIGRWQII